MSVTMSAPQLTDPGISSEWLRIIAGAPQAHATARRQYFQRLVAGVMVGLTAFAALGLACFAWRRHSLQAALEAPPQALVVQPASAPAVRPETENAVPAPVSDTAVPLRSAASKPLAKARPSVAKKHGARGATFLKNLKPQPAAMKRRQAARS
jgi:hypothetical protein